MNYISTLGNWLSDIGQGIIEFFWCVLAIIPKMIYFFFACFTSAIDAMQALIRKLAGLDVFYIKSGANSTWTSQGTEYANIDPLTEFIYGILGIGENAATYKSLNTVFWSLSVFALIVLVVCTMIAIIKSHYNEDYASTDPWKHIYAAIKAILTYAAMPVIVVIGMQLATFVLRTLDHITAGYSSEESLKGIYGQNVVQLFQDGTGTFDGIYGHYDYFGAGSPTSATTFGGMLFKAAAYSSNRARTGFNTQAQYTSIKHQGIQIFGNSSCAAYSALQAGTSNSTGSDVSAQVEYIAYQVDYAFQNNLRLNRSLSISTLNSAFGEVPYMRWVDAPTYQTVMNGFSKYNVTAIWFFYDLWQFNFIVAFGGGVTIFGLVLSIVFGLMSRLIKGAALFLIYPTMISIAPLDNFKAFKSWGQQFMSQILMAIGSITAVNILMLIIPYLNSFSFFGIGVIDAIVNMVLLITGIVMIKDFIGIVSGFIGAADAASEGEKAKGAAFNAVKTGFQTTAKIGMGTARFAIGGARLAGSAVKAGVNASVNRHRRNKYGDKLNKMEENRKQAEEEAKEAEENVNVVNTRQKLIDAASAAGKKKSLDELGIADTQENREAYEAMKNAVKNRGKGEKAEKAAEDAFNNTGLGKKFDVINQKATAEGKHVKDFTAENLKAKNEQVKEANDKITQAEEYVKSKGVDLKRGTIGKDKDNKDITAYVTSSNKDKIKEAKKEAEKERVKLARDMGDRAVNKYSAGGRALKTLKVAATPFTLMGKGIWKSFDAKKAGLQMADAFVKSLRAIPDALGFDKFLKGLKETIKGGLMLKGGPFEHFGKSKPLEGEAGQREANNKRAEEARRQQEATKATNELLKDVVQQLKVNNEAIKKGNEEARTYYSKPKS